MNKKIVLLLLLFIPVAYALPSTYTHQWSFENNLTDYVSNSIPLSASSGSPGYVNPAKFRNGSLNNGVQVMFNGTKAAVDYTTIGTGWALSVWVNMTAVANANYTAPIYILATNGAGRDRQIGINKRNSGAFDWAAFIGCSATTQVSWGGGAPVANTVYNLIANYDGTNLIFYVNGVKKANQTATCTTDFAGSDNTTGIGGYDTPSGTFGAQYNGWTDSVYVYNHVITDGACSVNGSVCGGEVFQLFNATDEPWYTSGGGGSVTTVITNDGYNNFSVSSVTVSANNGTANWSNTTNATGYANIYNLTGTISINLTNSNYNTVQTSVSAGSTTNFTLYSGYYNITAIDQYGNTITTPYWIMNDKGTSFANGQNVVLTNGQNNLTFYGYSYFNKTFTFTVNTPATGSLTLTNVLFRFPQQFVHAYTFLTNASKTIPDVNMTLPLSITGTVGIANRTAYKKYGYTPGYGNYAYNATPFLNYTQENRSWTIAFWVSMSEVNQTYQPWFFSNIPASSQSEKIFFAKDDDTSSNYGMISGVWRSSDGSEIELSKNGGGGFPAVNTGYWEALRWNGTNYTMYLNGILVNATNGTVITGDESGCGGAMLFAPNCPSSISNTAWANLSSLYIYDYALSDGGCTLGNTCSGDIADVYYAPYEYNGIGNFTIIANDIYSGSSINTFNATVEYAGANRTYSTTNGIITTNITDSSTTVKIWNIGYSTNDNPRYMNINYNNVSTANTFNAQLYQAVAVFNATEIESGGYVYNYTVTAPNQANTNNTPILYLGGMGTSDTSLFNITFNKTGWYNSTFIINVSAYTNYTYNITPYRFLLNITFNNSITGENISSFAANITSSQYSYSIINATTNKSVIVPWGNDTNFNITVYNSSTTSLTSMLFNTSNYTSLPVLISIKFSGVTTNSYSFSIFNELNGSLITDANITLYLTSSLSSYNISTNNGTYFISLLSPALYQLTATSNSYSTRTYYIAVTNQTTNTKNIYLIPTGYNTVKVTVYDPSYTALPNYFVSVTKKNLSGTSYYETERCKTDSNGQCIVSMVLCTDSNSSCPWYRAITYDPSETIILQDTGDIRIKNDQPFLTITVNNNDVVSSIINYYGTTQYVSTINSTTGVSTYYFDNSLGLASSISFVIQRRVGNSWSTLESLSTSGTGQLLLTSSVTNTSIGDEFQATGYWTDVNGVIHIGGKKNLIPVTSGIGASRNSAVSFVGLGIAIGPLVFMGATGPVLAPIISVALLYIMNLMGVASFTTNAIGAVIIIVAVTLWVMFS